jgi:hypothetical protein
MLRTNLVSDLRQARFAGLCLRLDAFVCLYHDWALLIPLQARIGLQHIFIFIFKDTNR